MILAVMNAIYAMAYIEAWKSQDFNGVWNRDLAIPVRRSNKLRYEATDVGSWSFVGSNEPVRNECEVIYMKYFIYNCFYIRNCINCVHNCEDHILLDFKIHMQFNIWNISYITSHSTKTLHDYLICISLFQPNSPPKYLGRKWSTPP